MFDDIIDFFGHLFLSVLVDNRYLDILFLHLLADVFEQFIAVPPLGVVHDNEDVLHGFRTVEGIDLFVL
jgi:hypothetical protein